MRRYTSIFTFLMLLALMGLSAFAQAEMYDDPKAEYTFEIPDPKWKPVPKTSTLDTGIDLVYVDRMDGFLQIRKSTTSEDEMLSEVIIREQEQRLQVLPGYVAGKEENFVGNLKGKAFNYEYVRSGKPMSGRIYFLKVDDKTVYLLKFTGLKDKLRAVRTHTDIIARTFKLK